MRIRQHSLNELLFCNGFAELFALQGVIQSISNQSLGDPDANSRNVQAAAIQYFHSSNESLTLFSDQVFSGYTTIFEGYITGHRAGLAHFFVYRSERYTWGITFNDKGRDTASTLNGRISARHNIESVGNNGVRYVSLGPIQNIVIAFTPSIGFQ